MLHDSSVRGDIAIAATEARVELVCIADVVVSERDIVWFADEPLHGILNQPSRCFEI